MRNSLLILAAVLTYFGVHEGAALQVTASAVCWAAAEGALVLWLGLTLAHVFSREDKGREG